MTRTLPGMTEEEMAALARSGDAGFGALSTERGSLPLQALHVQVRLDGLLARTVVEQTFVNTHAEPLEATYIFPLPDRAAVTSFRLEVAGRIVEGVLKERGQARQDYDQAIRAGQRAAITEEERPGVFTMRVGNLPPNESAIVRLTLAGPLPYVDGEATYRFPLVVAPRYIPGTALPGPSVGAGTAADTDAVPDASRISPPVLLPGFPNPVRLGLTVEIPSTGLPLHDFRSSLHTVVEEETSAGRLLKVQPGERLNRDFILRFRIAEERITTHLATQPDAGGAEGTFLLTVVPPRITAPQKPRDVVFVLDRSGSMAGWKMVAARRAVARLVETLTIHDRFSVLAFDNAIESPPGQGAGLIQATDSNRFHADRYLGGVEARGGTEMAEPLRRAAASLQFEAGAARERVLVLITDGQVGNEDQILRELAPLLRGIRVYTLGIDKAVNEAFLKRLAELGRGASSLVESEDRLEEVMDRVQRHLGTPVLTALKLEPAGLQVNPGSVVPNRLPDLFAGSPLLILGRYRGVPGDISLLARQADGGVWSVRLRAQGEASGSAAVVWARARLRELEDRYVVSAGDKTPLEKEIVDVSLRFSVLCRFTSFVAVDRSETVNASGVVHGIVQPVEQPEAWNNAWVTCSMAPAMGGVLRASRSRGRPMPSKKKMERADAFELAEDCEEAADMVHAAPPACASPPSQAMGWLQRLLALFGSSQNTKVIPPASIDASAFRARVEDVLRELDASPPDADARLRTLRAVVSRLEILFRDLVAAGDRRPTTQKLGETLQRLHSLLAQPTPADVDVHSVWDTLTATLREGIGAENTQRSGWWK